MSHFCTFVVVPNSEQRDDERVLVYLDRVLEPFSTFDSVTPHQMPCSCIGSAARIRANNQAHEKVSIEALNKSFEEKYGAVWSAMNEEGRLDEIWDMQETLWPEHFKPLLDAIECALELDPEKERPSATCPVCHGSGIWESTGNPNRKWDFWKVGGRFDGGVCGTWKPGPAALGHSALANNRLSVPEMRGKLPGMIKLDPNKLVLPQVILVDGVWHDFEDIHGPSWIGDLGRRRRWRKQAIEILERCPDDSVVVACDMHT